MLSKEQFLSSIKNSEWGQRENRKNFFPAGKTFGLWTILREVEPVHYAKHKVLLRRCLCRCACGRESVVDLSRLLRGKALKCHSCGRKTHGMSGTSIYNTWNAMLRRCENPKDSNFKDYGGRGIKVCERWHKFENFLKDMGPRPLGKTLDRIDNNGNYEPSKCRWIAMKGQSWNRRGNVRVVINGKKIPASEADRRLGFAIGTISYRIRTLKWTPEKAVSISRFGSLPRGEAHPSSKLTESQIKEIRFLKAEMGLGSRKLAPQFGVSSKTIREILSRRTWRHVP